MSNLGLYLLVGGVAAVAAWLLTPVWVMVARRLGAVDKPDDRKVHAAPTPTLGGLAMYAAFMVALMFAASLEEFRPQFVFSSEWLGIALGATLMTIIGAVDDVKGLTPPAKLAAQIFAAAVMTIPGVQVFSFWLPWVDNNVSLSPDISIPLTILIVIITANAVNLVDGLDGLAAGLVAIGALGYFVFSYRTGSAGLFVGDTPAPLISIIAAGVCLGFLPHNFNPAKVFMGDTGALFLGTLLSSATITGIGRTTEPQFADGVALVIPIALPALVMALPFLDVALSIVRRVRSGHGWMRADKKHLHHRLLAIGHSHRNAVLLLWVWSALVAGATVALSVTGPTRVLPIFGLAALAGAILLVAPSRRLAGMSNGRSPRPPRPPRAGPPPGRTGTGSTHRHTAPR